MIAENEKYTKRIETCKTCPMHDEKTIAHVVYVKCKQCGCNMNMKARFDGMKCPLGKW